jgi:DeoR/GlpR family transcriptional regulator of sugar metabolism
MFRSKPVPSHSPLPLPILEEIDTIVTDSAAPADLVEGLRQKGVEVFSAQ